MAVVQMGRRSFSVDTASLGEQNGSAVINLTQAQIQGMSPEAPG